MNPGHSASGINPPAAGSPRITRNGTSLAAGSASAASPASQSPFSVRIARTARSSNWVSASALAATSP
jgi:hypothetical protein